MKKIGIIGAMESEVRSLVAQLTDVRETHSGNTVLYAGTLSGVAVVVVQSGVGKVNAALCAQRLILQHAVTHVVNTGIAGGVSANVGIMDVVISTDAVYHDVDAVYFGYQPTEIPQMACSDFPADSGMIAAAERAFSEVLAGKRRMLKGRVASGDQFIASAAEKERIRARCHPLCVEMEGAAVAHACWLNGIPFVIIRSISDAADAAAGAASMFNEAVCAAESAALTARLVAYV
ncbi:MAG: 5'-methylthioadenosine/adenosylhomocysteine nucleosidase [Treponema sp.]|nr:5'-methylthioadenosine/adenosylhomocysteine nucleosidase [Treponema sp.]